MAIYSTVWSQQPQAVVHFPLHIANISIQHTKLNLNMHVITGKYSSKNSQNLISYSLTSNEPSAGGRMSSSKVAEK